MAVKAHKSVLARHLMLLFIMGGILVGLGQRNGLNRYAQAFQSSTPLDTSTPSEPQEMGPRAYDTRLVVDLSDRVVYLYRHDKIKASYRVAIGQKGWETPTGNFRIKQMIPHPTWQHPLTDEIFPPGLENPLGDRWIGFAADTTMKIGFHGTRETSSIGKAVSHGCLRMTNQNVRSLYEEVSLGTVVTVRP
ncbi:L,D-transpeptidase [Alkalinema pantanalense CENA528]